MTAGTSQLPVLQYEFSAEVLSHTRPPKGEKKARSVRYGPFADVAPLTLEPVEYHYVNNAPFAVAKTLERTLNVVWNTIHVDERYVVVSVSVEGSIPICRQSCRFGHTAA
jgi:hypothetical protein